MLIFSIRFLFDCVILSIGVMLAHHDGYANLCNNICERSFYKSFCTAHSGLFRVILIVAIAIIIYTLIMHWKIISLMKRQSRSENFSKVECNI